MRRDTNPLSGILLSEELFKGLRATEGTVLRAIPIPSPGFPVRTAVQVAASFLGRKEGAGRAEWLQLLVKERLGTSYCSLTVTAFLICFSSRITIFVDRLKGDNNNRR